MSSSLGWQDTQREIRWRRQRLEGWPRADLHERHHLLWLLTVPVIVAAEEAGGPAFGFDRAAYYGIWVRLLERWAIEAELRRRRQAEAGGLAREAPEG